MSHFLIPPIGLGLLAGWIVNYLSDVLPTTRRLGIPTCHACGTPFSWMHYLLHRPCPNGHLRPFRAWITPLVILWISLQTWSTPPIPIGYPIGMILIVYLATTFVIDMEHRLILHPVSIAGSILALGVGILSHGLRMTLIGGTAGLFSMLAFYFLGVLFTRARAKMMLARGMEADDEEALGAGDVILITLLGLMLGWPGVWIALFIGIFLGGGASLLILLFLVLTRKYDRNALRLFLPLGPYFITSAFLVIYFPEVVKIIFPG